MRKKLRTNSFADCIIEVSNQKDPSQPKIKNEKRVQIGQSDLKKQFLRRKSAQAFHVKCKELKESKLQGTMKMWELCKTMKELDLDFEGYYEITDSIFKRICIGLNGLCCLKSLKLNLLMNRNLLDKGAKHLSEALERLPNLECFSLCLTSYNKINVTIIEMLEKGLGNLLSLHCLDLKLICNDISDGILNQFARLLAQIRNLQTLNLHFSNCYHINSNKLISFGEELEKLRNLQYVNLTFQLCKNVNRNDLQQLHEKISKIATLKSFKIQFKSSVQDDLINLTKIDLPKAITFEISNCEKSADNNVDNLAKESLQLSFWKSNHILMCFQRVSKTWLIDLKSLKHLSLDLSFGCKNSERETFDDYIFGSEVSENPDLPRIPRRSKCLFGQLKPLFQEIKGLIGLEGLCLDLSSCIHLTFESFKVLIKSVQELNHLRSLTVDFSKNGGYREEKKDRLDCLIEGLKQIQEKVALVDKKDVEKSAPFGMITDSINCLKDVKRQISFQAETDVARNEPKIFEMQIFLSSFLEMFDFFDASLNAYDYDSLDNAPRAVHSNENQKEAILSRFRKDLRKAARNCLKKVQELHQFSSKMANPSIEEESLEKANCGLNSLERICLNFEQNAEIDDEKLCYISGIIKTTFSLKHIDLNFSQCKEITRAGFEHLSETLKSLENLKSLNLNFSGCSRTITSCLVSLENELKPIIATVKLLNPEEQRIKS